MGEKTRRAYGVDLAQLGAWAAERGLGARASSPTATCAASPPCSASAARPSRRCARKLAAIRTFYRHLLERGEIEAQPGRPRLEPQEGRLPAAGAEARRGGRAARAHPCLDAARPARSCACSSWPTRAGLRAEELVNLDAASPDPDAEQVRVEGKGGRTRVVPAGEHAWRALERYLARARPALRRGAEQALFLSKSGRRLSTSDVRRRLKLQARRVRHLPAHAAAFVRHPPARGRGGPAHDPGAARTCVHQHDPDLHSGRVEAPQDGVRALSPPRLSPRPRWRPTSRR